MRNKEGTLGRLTRPIRALARVTVFFLKVFPMLPSRPVDWVTGAPVVQKVRYPTIDGEAEGDLYRPPDPGPHPGVVVCLGVVPFGVDHPQVPVMGKALARAGFATLLHWSPSMREFCLVAEDIENIALAYGWLADQPHVDAGRSGILGTCVGGSFTLMAASHPSVRERVAFASAYAPFSSMWTLARDVASSTRSDGESHTPWRVDQLTRKVFVYSLTATLHPAERDSLRQAFGVEGRQLEAGGLSPEGSALQALMTATSPEAADEALHRLPADMQERLTALSPLNYIQHLRAPLIVLLHDVGDQVVPIGESRRLVAALEGRAGVHFTEMQFSHLDPSKGRLPLPRLVREFAKFFRAMYPVFRQAVN